MLTEAIIAAVVITVGIVMISRTFSTHLRALQSMQTYDERQALAYSVLDQMEQRLISGSVATGVRNMPFGQSDSGFGWSLFVGQPIEDEMGFKLSDVRVEVASADPKIPKTILKTRWPSDRIPLEWF